MKNKIVVISSVLIVILCIGIAQLPGIYAAPQDYSDYYGIVISEDDNFHKNLPDSFSSGPICYTFRTQDSNNAKYPEVYDNDPGYIANYKCFNSIYHINWNSNPYPNISIPDQLDEESFWKYIFTISKYWKIDEIIISSYNRRLLKFIPYNYTEPEFRIECNPSQITPGETSQCELKVNYHSKIKSLNFKLDTDQYNISELRAGDDFENLEVTEGVYTLVSKNTLEDSEEGRDTTVISFVIKSDNESILSTDNIKVLDLEYEDELSESPKKIVSATVKQSKKENKDIKDIINNPKTKNNILIVIGLLTFIIVSIIITSKRRTKNNILK